MWEPRYLDEQPRSEYLDHCPVLIVERVVIDLGSFSRVAGQYDGSSSKTCGQELGGGGKGRTPTPTDLYLRLIMHLQLSHVGRNYSLAEETCPKPESSD